MTAERSQRPADGCRDTVCCVLQPDRHGTGHGTTARIDGAKKGHFGGKNTPQFTRGMDGIRLQTLALDVDRVLAASTRVTGPIPAE